MKHTKTFFTALLILWLTCSSVYANTGSRSVTIINNDKYKSIFVYYVNILTTHVQRRLEPKTSWTISLDSLVADPVMIHLPPSIARLALCVPMQAGDTLRLTYDNKHDTYRFQGRHPTEYRYFRMLEAGKLNLTPASYWTMNQYRKLSYEAYWKICQAVFRRIDSLTALIRNDSLARPSMKKYVADEFNLVKIGFLTQPVDYEKLIEYRNLVPAFYRDSLARYGKVLDSMVPSGVCPSELFIYTLKNYAQFLTLMDGNVPNVSNTFAKAHTAFTDGNRNLACYYLLKHGQDENADIQPELALFKTMVPARSPYWRELMKYEVLNAYDLPKDSAFQDMVQTLRGDSVKLRDIIEKNKGNLILIDFWASWCVPCIMGLPYTAALQEKYAGRNLKVIYVSIDSDKAKWKEIESTYVCNHEDSYCLTDMMKSRLVRKFRISSIPRYMLIDHQGIVRQHRALSPDDPALVPIIEALLQPDSN